MSDEGIEVLTPEYTAALVVSRAVALGLPMAISAGGQSFQDGLLKAVAASYGERHLYFAAARDAENQAVLHETFREKHCAFVDGEFGSLTFLNFEKAWKAWATICTGAGIPVAMLSKHLQALLVSLYEDGVVLAEAKAVDYTWYASRFEVGQGPVFNLAPEQ